MDDVINLLGETASPEECFGPSIHKDIIPRWDCILKKGLKDEIRQTLLDKFPSPINFKHLTSPKLNVEVKDAVNTQILRRDTRLSEVQQQISASLIAIGSVISNMLEGEGGKNRECIETLSNACKLLADVHYKETLSRRELILLNLSQDFKDTLKDAPIGDYLFGENLDERVNVARNRKRFSQGLRATPRKPTFNSINKTFNQTPGNLNFKRPLGSFQMQSLRPQGGQQQVRLTRPVNQRQQYRYQQPQQSYQIRRRVPNTGGRGKYQQRQ